MPDYAGISRRNDRTNQHRGLRPFPPAWIPPQTELAMRPGRGQADEVAQESFPDDLDQSSEFDPTESEPIPEDDLDQSW